MIIIRVRVMCRVRFRVKIRVLTIAKLAKELCVLAFIADTSASLAISCLGLGAWLGLGIV
jgi:hypothetical protein